MHTLGSIYAHVIEDGRYSKIKPSEYKVLWEDILIKIIIYNFHNTM